MKKPLVSIIMGSNSDYPVMKEAAEILDKFKIPFEINIVSAHRTPDRMFEFANDAHERGIKVIIAGAGGAAHLPGMVASISPLPVIGVPVKSSNSLDGWDSLLSIVQMPSGVPVATVAVNGSKNAGILAVQILASADNVLQKKLLEFKENLKKNVVMLSAELQKQQFDFRVKS
ncbi:MAG: 5-(carboxyamino)imidazole ribonucleotide mutase [Bacteroidota bacterium]